MKTAEKLPQAMGFFHRDGFPAAWKQAAQFAGTDGHIATLPDIIKARLATKPGDYPWETYFTTRSAEYIGTSRHGNRILIVAHGIGPMSTLDGATKGYRMKFKDQNHRMEGGRIIGHKFWDLEAGKFGDVSVIDLDEYCKRYQYSFIMSLRLSEAMTDPVVIARLGPQAEEYLVTHAEHARLWHQEQATVDPEAPLGITMSDKFLKRRREQHLRDGAVDGDPYIIRSGGSMYKHLKMDGGLAIVHLLSIGRLCNMHHEGNESLVFDVDTYEWSNGTRLVGIKAGENLSTGITAGPDANRLLRRHWQDLLLPVEGQEVANFHSLVKFAKEWFTEVPKVGDGMDSGEPEYAVTSIETIGEPVLFRTTIGGYHGFFKYAVNEVKALAPPSANAYYFVGDPQIEGEHHTCMVQFYRVEADTSKRLMPADKLARDYDLMMKLMAKEASLQQ